MTVYNWHNDPPPPRAKIVDAHGIEHAKVIKVDTVTGYLERYPTDQHDQVIPDPSNPGHAVRDRKTVAAPVQVVF